MSLRLRLALLFAGVTAAVIAVAGVVFLWQLRAAQLAALDVGLRVRADAVAAEVRAARPLSLPAAGGGQQGQQQGQFSGADEVTQVLTVRGGVLYSSAGAGDVPLVTGSWLRRAFGGPVAFTAQAEGEPVRVLAFPARNASRPVVIAASARTGVADAAQARARAVILAAGPVAVAAAGLGAWVLAGAALRPVERMRRRLDDITERNPGARLRVSGSQDEIASLAVTMNALLDRLQAAVERERDFVADASHELLTPLTALRAELELARRPGRSRQALDAAVAAAEGDTDRLIHLAQDLLLLARAQEGNDFLRPRQVSVPGLLSAAARAFAAQAHACGVTLEVAADPALTVAADPDRLRQALDNLLGNAIRHSPAGGVVELTARASGRGDGARVVIDVRDHGPGFPPEFLPHAFERFRRADAARSRAAGGTGLGLAIVASIARAHHGRAAAANHPRGGARVSIEIPPLPPPSPAGTVAPGQPSM
jgi:two-component system, OmpR family, sensor kinase